MGRIGARAGQQGGSARVGQEPREEPAVRSAEDTDSHVGKRRSRKGRTRRTRRWRASRRSQRRRTRRSGSSHDQF